MKKGNTTQYIIEREFLAKFSVEELVVRIVKAHLGKGGAVPASGEMAE